MLALFVLAGRALRLVDRRAERADRHGIEWVGVVALILSGRLLAMIGSALLAGLAPHRAASRGPARRRDRRGRRRAGLLQPGQLLADRHRRCAARWRASAWRSSSVAGRGRRDLDPVHHRRPAVRVLHRRPPRRRALSFRWKGGLRGGPLFHARVLCGGELAAFLESAARCRSLAHDDAPERVHGLVVGPGEAVAGRPGEGVVRGALRLQVAVETASSTPGLVGRERPTAL